MVTPDSEIGLKRLGDFEILREIGRGGMGIVYEARQKSLNRRVALKVLSTGLGLTTKAIMRFKREAEAAARLHHTNIVPIYATGEENRVPYYVMELVEGPSLDHVIRQMRAADGHGEAEIEHDSTGSASSGSAVPGWVAETICYERSPSPGNTTSNKCATNPAGSSSLGAGSGYFDTVAGMMAEVADALAHAHDQGVIHRDVKPSNLLLSPEGRLSINDFGLARMLEQPGMTISGEFMGSPMYMSPEQITAGRIPLDHRTDIYSLGTALYELLTLRPPFEGQQRDQILSQIIHKDAVPPRKVNSTVPKDLETVCLKAMDKDPDRRYQTADQLAEDLRRYVDRHAILARRTGPVEKSIRYLRRNPFAAAFVGLLIVTITVLSLVGWRVTRGQRLQELSRIEQELSRIENDLLMAVLRGDYDGANIYLREGEQLGADSSWVEFSRGQISLYQGEYEAAKTSFNRVVEDDPENVAAKALRAVAFMWGGDEISYFEQLADIDPARAEGFRDFLFLGYANIWGNPEEALRLLRQADRINANHTLVRVFRAQAGRLRAMQLLDRTKAKRLIDRALDDCEATMGLLAETPLVFHEYAFANLAAANIYKFLGEHRSADVPVDSDQLGQILDAAKSMRTQLESFPNNSDAQYALVLLLQLTRDDPAIVDLAARWDRDDVKVHTYSAQALGIALFRARKYEQALHWLALPRDRQAANTRFLEFYVRLADPGRRNSREGLLKEVQAYVNGKLSRNERSYYSFDSTLLMLLGDEDALQFYGKDTLDPLIMGGAVYRAHSKYFAPVSERSITTPDELIEQCNASPAPIASRMQAHFGLGIEAMSKQDFPAAEIYFRKCLDDGLFHFYVYWLSDAVLAHQKDWPRWIP